MLTPNEAAKVAKVSRPTIMKSISDKALHAIRDNKNRWQISEDALQEWMQGRPQVDTVETVNVHVDQHAEEVAGLRLELVGLKGELKGKDELIAQLRQDLEHARLPFWRKLLG